MTTSFPEEDAVPDPQEPLEAGRALGLLAELRVAHEELRVAEEEMRDQQEQIDHLLSGYEAERRWRSQLSGLVPVALCTTDGAGALTDANPAMAHLLELPLHRLRGKPLAVYLDRGDVSRFRSVVRELASGTTAEHRLQVTLRGRRQGRSAADLFGFADHPAGQSRDTRLQWVLVPAVPAGTSRSPDGERRDDEHPAGDRAASGLPAAGTLGLAAALAELATLPIEAADRQRLLSRMAVLVRSAVPAADGVSITLGSPLAPQQLGSDSVTAQEADGRQVQAEEGPCWDAHVTGRVVLTPDVTVDRRWPRLARRSEDAPVRSVLAVPLREGEQPVGVLNVYSAAPDAFDGDSRRIAELVGAAVGGVLQSVAERESLRDLAANLEKALTSRAVIDQAKGVLIARLGIDAEDAFARLVALSNRLNIKVRDLAHLVVEGNAAEVLAAGER
ncbi:ANTAR domain-containing protein [Geodermatophilus marinus]|uniref:ANTAR domain-containing protein n=1 Tax=Geodermatophilus sp. LHW52908 TaxID=2303986 RepID=UPI000E3D41D3|nr:ANTAR domain-containing protein [Geodermatophilus sp. LHW52908]RFU21524.1 ANTAR domain-containing protein [Geodermatophilus sp. LHW52908]